MGALEILGSVVAAISVVALALPFMARIRAITVTSRTARKKTVVRVSRERLRAYQARGVGHVAGVDAVPPPPGWEQTVIDNQSILYDRLNEMQRSLMRVETNNTWLIRIVGVQFAFLSAVAFTA